MDAYELYWLIKTIWMNNCDNFSGRMTVPEKVKVVIKNKEEYINVVGAVYNKEVKAIEIILEDKNEKK